MGRGKLDMELIRKEKSRILTFKKRKEGLIKKLHELTTLCDVRACMVIYGPVQKNCVVEPAIWPQNHDEVRRMIDVFKTISRDSGSSKSFGLTDFFQERRRKVEEELARLRKKNVEAKYPTWDEFLNFLNAAELRALAAGLNSKAQVVKSRIELLKREKQEPAGVMKNVMMMDFAPPDLSGLYTALNHDRDIMPIVDMHSMNLNHNSGGNCTSSFERQVSCDQTAAAAAAAATFGDGLGNPLICNYEYTMPLPQIYYEPPMLQPVVSPPPPQLLPYMKWSMVAPPAQLQLSSNHNLNYHDQGVEDDIIRHLLQYN